MSVARAQPVRVTCLVSSRMKTVRSTVALASRSARPVAGLCHDRSYLSMTKTDMQTMNQWILRRLTSAPICQLTEELRQEAVACDVSNPNAILTFFKKVYAAKGEERSSFVMAMVNPYYTSDPEYSIPRLPDEAEVQA